MWFNTWSLTLREEKRFKAFGNRMSRRIFGPNMEEVAGGWIKLHNEEIRNFYSSPNIVSAVKSRREIWDEMGEHAWGYKKCIQILVGETWPLGRLRCRREDNIRMDLTEISWEGVDWIYVDQDKDQCRTLVNTVMNLRVIKNGGGGDFLTILVIISF